MVDRHRGPHPVPGLPQDPQHVGQVLLALAVVGAHLAQRVREQAPSNANTPELISRIARCARWRPCAPRSRSPLPMPRSRTIRPYPVASGTSAVSTVTALPSAACVAARCRSVFPGEQRSVAADHDDGARRGRLRAAPVPPGPSVRRVRCPLLLLHRGAAAGSISARCAATCSRACPTTTTSCSGASSRAAASTCPTRERPQISCSIFGVADFIRVPGPAASTITAAATGAAGLSCSNGARTGRLLELT